VLLDGWREHYNKVRPHSSLGLVHQRWKQSQKAAIFSLPGALGKEKLHEVPLYNWTKEWDQVTLTTTCRLLRLEGKIRSIRRNIKPPNQSSTRKPDEPNYRPLLVGHLTQCNFIFLS